MDKLRITVEQAEDESKCPICSSLRIEYHESGCLCRIPNHSCWSHPVCLDCGYTAGSGSGNSDRGMWVKFACRPIDGFYEINISNT